MPTGFTAPIYEGKDITFKEFVLRCARGMMACVSMREYGLDAPIPERFEPDPYCAKRTAEMEAAYRSALAMTIEEADRAAADCYVQQVADARRINEDKAATRARYMEMLAAVNAWQPPTPEHDGLKEFMVKQLTECMDFDCGYTMPNPKMETGAEWLAAKTDQCLRMWERAKDDEQRAIERARQNTAWIAALRASLGE